MARIDERVTAMRSEMSENMATKNDITNLKVWILAGVLGGIGTAAFIATVVVKAFF